MKRSFCSEVGYNFSVNVKAMCLEGGTKRLVSIFIPLGNCVVFILGACYIGAMRCISGAMRCMSGAMRCINFLDETRMSMSGIVAASSSLPICF